MVSVVESSGLVGGSSGRALRAGQCRSGWWRAERWPACSQHLVVVVENLFLSRSDDRQRHLFCSRNVRDWPVSLSLLGLASRTGSEARNLCVENGIFFYFVLCRHGVHIRLACRMDQKEI